MAAINSPTTARIPIDISLTVSLEQTNDDNARLYFYSTLYRYSFLFSRHVYTESLQYWVGHRSDTEWFVPEVAQCRLTRRLSLIQSSFTRRRSVSVKTTSRTSSGSSQSPSTTLRMPAIRTVSTSGLTKCSARSYSRGFAASHRTN